MLRSTTGQLDGLSARAGGSASLIWPRVVDLVDELGLAQSTVSKHLACLRDCELVSSEPVGRASVFRLTQSGLTGLLGAADIVLAATGNAVALCATYGIHTGEQAPA
ncbi:MAG TPA: ArsR family transcriptional regulator [Gemmatimonadales bacterium]|nr:ArsR family transcriptional regulator [Gemmatimonadales bacterium]